MSAEPAAGHPATPPFRSNAAVPEIAGQMSDAERALQDNIERTIAAPMMAIDRRASPAATLATLKEAMSYRSAHARLLREEQQVAYSAAARRDLHNQAVENDRQSLEATSYLKRIPGMIDNGMTIGEIGDAFLKERPELAGNKFFLDQWKEYKAHSKTKADIEAEKISDATKVITARSSQAENALSLLENQGKLHDAEVQYEANRKAGEMEAGDILTKAATSSTEAEIKRREAERKLAGQDHADAMQKQKEEVERIRAEVAAMEARTLNTQAYSENLTAELSWEDLNAKQEIIREANEANRSLLRQETAEKAFEVMRKQAALREAKRNFNGNDAAGFPGRPDVEQDENRVTAIYGAFDYWNVDLDADQFYKQVRPTDEQLLGLADKDSLVTFVTKLNLSPNPPEGMTGPDVLLAEFAKLSDPALLEAKQKGDVAAEKEHMRATSLFRKYMNHFTDRHKDELKTMRTTEEMRKFSSSLAEDYQKVLDTVELSNWGKYNANKPSEKEKSTLAQIANAFVSRIKLGKSIRTADDIPLEEKASMLVESGLMSSKKLLESGIVFDAKTGTVDASAFHLRGKEKADKAGAEISKLGEDAGLWASRTSFMEAMKSEKATKYDLIMAMNKEVDKLIRFQPKLPSEIAKERRYGSTSTPVPSGLNMEGR